MEPQQQAVGAGSCWASPGWRGHWAAGGAAVGVRPFSVGDSRHPHRLPPPVRHRPGDVGAAAAVVGVGPLVVGSDQECVGRAENADSPHRRAPASPGVDRDHLRVLEHRGRHRWDLHAVYLLFPSRFRSSSSTSSCSSSVPRSPGRRSAAAGYFFMPDTSGKSLEQVESERAAA